MSDLLVAQAPAVSYYYLVEALKYQKPAVVVIDTSRILFEDYDVDKKEGKLRTAIDPMKLSTSKLSLIWDVVSLSEEQTISSYLMPFLRYHSRWDELKEIDFQPTIMDNLNPYKGFFKVDLQIAPPGFSKGLYASKR